MAFFGIISCPGAKLLWIYHEPLQTSVFASLPFRLFTSHVLLNYVSNLVVDSW